MRLLVVLALAAGACSSRESSIAKLEQIVAQVERMPTEGAAWRAARVGDTFVLGSAVRTGPASRARLVLGNRGHLDVDANAVVHFSRTPGSGRGNVYIETGNVEIEAGDEPIGLVGEVMLERGARAKLSRQQGQLTINVTLGNVLLEDDAGPVTVAAGTSITVGNDGKRTASDKPQPSGSMTIVVTGVAARSGQTALPPGQHRLDVGAQLDVPSGSTVEISRDGARAVATGPSTLRTGGSPGALATASTGTLALYGTTSDASADVPGGSIIARSGGSETSAKLGTAGTQVEARHGETSIRTATREDKLAAGEVALLAPDGTIERSSQAPARIKLGFAAGESPVVHDPAAPTPLSVSFGSACTGAGVVEISKDRSFKKIVAKSSGRDAANLMVPAGQWRYRVRCDTGKGASGSIQIARDSGRTPLPKAAARTTVEADGREYTILYENRLPELELVWRDAPAAAHYQFVLEPANGKPRKLASPSPRLNLRSGELAEGSYRFWVENLDKRTRSERARIVIDFNNAAASASIESVEVKDGKVRVRGSVIEGSTVTAAGAPVELDRHRRFEAELAPKPEEDGIGIRIAHPKAGVHYYVVSTSVP